MHGIMKWAAGAVLWGVAAAASATSVTYDVTNQGGSVWEYDFTVSNDTVGAPIPEVTLFFDYNSFSALSAPATPDEFNSAGLPPLVVQPVVPSDLYPSDPLAQDGYVDYLAGDAGLAAGASLAGFVVDVTFSGGGTPGGPTFTTYDANFNVLDSGTATPNVVAGVPEPSTLALVGLALIGMGASFARRRAPRR